MALSCPLEPSLSSRGQPPNQTFLFLLLKTLQEVRRQGQPVALGEPWITQICILGTFIFPGQGGEGFLAPQMNSRSSSSREGLNPIMASILGIQLQEKITVCCESGRNGVGVDRQTREAGLCVPQPLRQTPSLVSEPLREGGATGPSTMETE